MDYPKKRKPRRRNPDGTFMSGRSPECSRCGGPRTGTKGYCKACAAAYYRDNRERLDVKNKAARKVVYDRNSKIIYEAKSVPCADCGVSYPPYVMDFDHRGDQPKVADISKMRVAATQKVLDEIAKCDVVCSNCHRIRTFKRLKERGVDIRQWLAHVGDID